MNAIFNLAGADYVNRALSRIINDMQFENLFLIGIDENALKHVNAQATEKYLVRKEIAPQLYSSKVGYDKISPLDAEIVNSVAPYLSNMVKMYSRTQWGLLSYEERLRKVYIHLEYWNFIIDKYNIDMFVTQNVPHEIYDYIIYVLCKIKGVKTGFTYFNPTYANSYALTDINEHCPEVRIEYERLYKQYINSEIDDIILSAEYQNIFDIQSGNSNVEKTPYYMKTKPKKAYNTGKPSAPSIFMRASNMLGNFKKYGVKGYINDVYLPAKEQAQIIENNSKRLNIMLAEYNQYWEEKSQNIEFDKLKYIYFPLHMQPECSSLPLGGCFENQILAIKMLSASLTQGYYILVKENPKQTITQRQKEFIDDLCLLKNVKLVSKATDTFELLDNCIAVASITGTAIWEGIFKAKPAIMFGNFITEHAPGVFKVTTNEQCIKALDTILQGEVLITLKHLKVFMLAMQNVCLPADLQHLAGNTEQEKEDNMYKLFLHVFEKMEILQKESVLL